MSRAVRVCAYCRRPYAVMEHHLKDCLPPYCSAGCKAGALLVDRPKIAMARDCVSIDAMPPCGFERAVSAARGESNWRVHDAREAAGECERDLDSLRFGLLAFLGGLPNRVIIVACRRARMLAHGKPHSGGVEWRGCGGDRAKMVLQRALDKWPELRAYFRSK